MNKKFVWIIAIVLTISLGVGMFFILARKDDSQENNNIPENSFTPVLQVFVNDKIAIYNDESPFIVKYTVDCNEQYSVEFTANNDNVLLNNNIITPCKVGESIINVFVKSISLQVNKNIKVTILPSKITASMNIFDDTKQVTNLFTQKTYILEITLNKKLNYSHNLFGSTNVNNLHLVKMEDYKMQYTFTVSSFGKVRFDFVYKDYTNFIECDSYDYVNDINIDFSQDLQNNEIKLYLFNKNFQNYANDDNIFDFISFDIQQKQGVINEYSTEIVNTSIAEISNNKIIAKCEGKTRFNVIANDGSNFVKSYFVNVENVKLTSLSFTQQTVQLKVNEIYTFELDYSPCYAIYDLAYTYNNLPYNQNTISFDKVGEYQLNVFDSFSNISSTITFSVTSNKSNFELTFNSNFLENNNATFENDTLTINSNSENNILYFSYKLNTDIQANNIACDFAYQSSSITFANQPINDANSVIIQLVGKGEISITMTLKENSNISYTFVVIIN